MSNEVDDKDDDIPQGDGPYETGLWAEARAWVGWLINLYGNVREIALVGLSRRTALRCRNWLWSIEGIVRRLIIAAAMRLDPDSLAPPSKPKATTRKSEPETASDTPGEPARPASAFRVLGLHGRPGASRKSQVKPAHIVVPEHRHLSFPLDDLLRLGAAPQQGVQRSVSGHRPHPLDRRGRISRWDPDYRSDPVKEAESYRRYFFGPFPVLPDRFSRPPKERRHRDIHDPYYRSEASVPEHRRIEEEWARVIPAPDIAGRIMALHRVMADPKGWIARTARQLQLIKRLAEVLRALPEPKLVKPRRDRGPIPPGLSCLSLCHAAIVAPDTS
jgi:hypothetical protein